MKKVFATLAALSAIGLSGAASAQEPVQLTSAQMDQVTAGASSSVSVTVVTSSSGGASPLVLLYGPPILYNPFFPLGFVALHIAITP